MGLGDRRIGLWRSPATQSVPNVDATASRLTEIAGLSGWWDASTPEDLFGVNGQPIAAWREAVSALADKSGGGNPMLPYSVAPTGRTAIGRPRLSGLLGGVGMVAPDTALAGPVMHTDFGYQ